MQRDTHRRAGVIQFRRTGPLPQLGLAVRGAGIWPPTVPDAVMTALEQARPSWGGGHEFDRRGLSLAGA
jgi:hypothetical protein